MARERWQVLLDHAMRHVQGLPQRYALGGGTVLRLFYDHRDSNDIDIFLFDPQLLAYVSPRTNDTLEDAMSDYLETEYFTKLKFPEGEIDFIPAANLTGLMPEPRAVDGHTLPVEHPVEIIAKKVHYRLKHFKSRDIFDLLTVYKFAREALCGKKSFFEPYINALRERCQLLLDPVCSCKRYGISTSSRVARKSCANMRRCCMVSMRIFSRYGSKSVLFRVQHGASAAWSGSARRRARRRA